MEPVKAKHENNNSHSRINLYLVSVTAIQKNKDRSIKSDIIFYVSLCSNHKVCCNLRISRQKCFVHQLLCNYKNVHSLIAPYLISSWCPLQLGALNTHLVFLMVNPGLFLCL